MSRGLIGAAVGNNIQPQSEMKSETALYDSWKQARQINVHYQSSESALKDSIEHSHLPCSASMILEVSMLESTQKCQRYSQDLAVARTPQEVQEPGLLALQYVGLWLSSAPVSPAVPINLKEKSPGNSAQFTSYRGLRAPRAGSAALPECTFWSHSK